MHKIQANHSGTRSIAVEESHLSTIAQYHLLDHLVDSNGIVDENVLDKLKFKTAMFEGVLDNGEDAIFIGDQSKLKAMMDDLSQMMEEGKDDDEVVDDATEEAAMPPTDAPLQDEEAADTPDLPSDENTEDSPIPRNEWGERDEERETAPSQPTAASKSEEETSEKQPEAGETPGTPASKEMAGRQSSRQRHWWSKACRSSPASPAPCSRRRRRNGWWMPSCRPTRRVKRSCGYPSPTNRW